MSTPDFSAIAARHRNYFRSGATRPVEWREGQLTALRAMMTDRAEDFYAALWTDLRRNLTDADLTDVKYLASEADHALSHLQQWMKPPPAEGPVKLRPVRIIGNRRCRWSIGCTSLLSTSVRVRPVRARWAR